MAVAHDFNVLREKFHKYRNMNADDFREMLADPAEAFRDFREFVDIVGKLLDYFGGKLDQGLRREVYADLGGLLARKFPGGKEDFAAWVLSRAEGHDALSGGEAAGVARAERAIASEQVILRAVYEKGATGYVVRAIAFVRRADGNVDKLESERVITMDQVPNDVLTQFLAGNETKVEFSLS